MDKKPRINIEIDEELKHRVQVKVVSQKKTITEIVVKLLKIWVNK